MKFRELIADAEKILAEAGIEEYKNDAWRLFEDIFQVNRGKYFMIMNDDVDESDEKKQQFQDAISRRSQRIPLQHILGYQIFMGLSFLVNEHVLTPRPETELLVEKALQACERKYELTGVPVSVLDMCTGSGCIAVSIKKLSKVPVRVSAVDLSEKALEIAMENARLNNCEIEFTQSDLFDRISSDSFDIIVSNPPYICSDVIPTLMEEVREHEPHMALDGSADGLKFYRKISEDAKFVLPENGNILYEIGYDQGETVANILRDNGYDEIEVKKDYAGLDRMVMAVRK